MWTNIYDCGESNTRQIADDRQQKIFDTKIFLLFRWFVEVKEQDAIKLDGIT